MPPPALIHFMEPDGAKVGNIAVLTFKNGQDGMVETRIPIFPGKDIFVGRDKDACSPSIQSTIVSRVHFRIYSIIYDDDLITEFPPLIYCEDRQSSNGTYINDTLIGTISSPRSPYLLSNGDVISIRPHWTFHFHQKKQTNGRNLDDLQSQELELFKGRYTISDRLLGSGVYGSVYLANDLVTPKQLACKVVDLRRNAVDPGGSETPLNVGHRMKVQAYAEKEKVVAEVRKKLIREVEILSKLSHPNIATLYKAFRTPHTLYIFNELAAGGDLFSFLQTNGPCLEDLHARIISRQVAIAVDYLHSHGIAHRDLKPENILVMRTGIGHRVVLTDFGCAGYIGINAGRMMSTVGTFDYVAPEVHRPKSKGYTEAIDMWSMGIITLCLLTGDAFISFEELQTMNQSGITAKLATASGDYPQWRHLNFHGKDFVKRLLVLEPLKRMMAKEAVNHDWFRKPARIALELDKLYERATVFWSQRSNYIGIIEDLPDVIGPEDGQSTKRDGSRSKSAGKRVPDAASPYFSLDRHLQPKGARTRSILHSKRKRILEELKEADSQFLANPTQLKNSLEITNTRRKTSFPLSRKKAAIGISQSTAPLPRPPEPSLASTPIKITLSSRPGRPADVESRKRKPIMNNALGAHMNGRKLATTEGTESGEAETLISANTPRCRKLTPETGLSMRQVNANDLFGTIPIEIKAAKDAEAAHAAYDEMYESFTYIEDGGSEDDALKRPAKLVARSYTFSLEERELYDEAARDLPKLSTAKAYSTAIKKRKQLKGSQEKEDKGLGTGQYGLDDGDSSSLL